MTTQSENIDLLFTALAKAQGSMTAATKDSSNPFFKSKYADLNSVWNACREPLSSNGLAIIQTIQNRENGDVLYTILGHSSGQWISSSMPLRIKSDGKTNELQVLGSAISYLRRYSLMAIVGIAPGDEDDGQAASGYQAKADPVQKQKLISHDQAIELRQIISTCSPEYKKYILNFLEKNNFKLISDLPESLFIQVRDASITARDQFVASQETQEVAS